jgi:hypothetical protein
VAGACGAGVCALATEINDARIAALVNAVVSFIITP